MHPAAVSIAAFTGSEGWELWESDGTEGGTVMVKDINPGSGSSYPAELIAVGGMLYSAAREPSTWTELWALVTSACGNGIVDPGESCDDANTDAGDGCDESCQLENGWTCPVPGNPCAALMDHYVAYKVKAPTKDAAGAEIPNNVFPKGWVITVDDVEIDDADADDPENFEVKKGLGLLNPAAKNDGASPARAQWHYLRYKMAAGKETVGTANPDGSYNKPPKHIARV